MNKSLELLKAPVLENENKIIFLDIGGVLQPIDNQERFDHDLKATAKMLTEKYHDDNFLKLDIYDVGAVYYDWNEISLGVLKQLLRDTKSNIVISSDWRDSINLEGFKTLFKIYDLDDYVVDVCRPDTFGKGDERKEAINEYVASHKVDKYVVIDDRNYATFFGVYFRRVNDIINLDDFYYLKFALNYNPKFYQDNQFVGLSNNFSLRYRIVDIDQAKVMLLEKNGSRTYFKHNIEYLLSYMLTRKDIDLYVLNMDGINLENLNVNGYIANDGNYYIFKNCDLSYQLNDTIRKIKVKKLES